MRRAVVVDSARQGLGVGGVEVVRTGSGSRQSPPSHLLTPRLAYVIEDAPQAPLNTITHIKVDAWSVAGVARTGQGVER